MSISGNIGTPNPLRKEVQERGEVSQKSGELTDKEFFRPDALPVKATTAALSMEQKSKVREHLPSNEFIIALLKTISGKK